MPSAHESVRQPRRLRISVRARLTTAFLAVITLSWLLGGLTFRYLMNWDLEQFSRLSPQQQTKVRIEMNGPLGGPSDNSRTGSQPFDAVRDPRRPPSGPGPWNLPRYVNLSMVAQAAGGIVLALLSGWWLSRRFTSPLAELAEGARAFDRTQFSHRVPVTGNDEFTEVAASMNDMAHRVGRQIAELEADAHRRQQILADVAHELRSPVQGLGAMTDVLLSGVADSPERQRKALASIRDSTERMERLVTDLLEIARLDLHELPLVCAPVDLREVADDAVTSHRHAAQAAGQRMLPVEDGPPVAIEADRLRLSQVLDNLMENAIAYAGAGAEVGVHVTQEPPGFVVEDTGAGIARDHLPFVFDPFYRADQARTPGESHSGLGLRIARGIVEAHGGTLSLESEEGRGTRAVVTLRKSESSRSTTAIASV